MKSHLALVAQVSDISPILAFRSLFPWEGGDFESCDYEPALVVHADSSNEDCRGLYLAGANGPCLTATVAGDDVTIHRAGAEVCPDVATILAALGMGRGKGSSFLLQGPGEQLYDRVLTLDSAWVLLRRLRATIAAGIDLIATAQTLLQLALDWHVLRSEMCDKGESPARAAREKQIINRARAFSSWGIQGLLSVELLPDPRESAMALEMDGFHRMDLAPLVFDWPTGSVTVEAEAPGAAKRGRFDVAPTRVPEKVLGVLNALAIEGNAVRIVGRLDKSLYGKVDEVLQGLGGGWHTGQQAHVFDTPPGELIDEVVRSGAILLPRDYECFETQLLQVKQVIDLARIEPEMRVLEG